MKTTLLFLFVFTSLCLFGQEERGYLIIENKGKTACFFDTDDPFSFISLYKNIAQNGGINHKLNYEKKIYPELDKYQSLGRSFRFRNEFGEEFSFEKEANKEFLFWFDSISNRWNDEEYYLGSKVSLERWQSIEERIFQCWVNTPVGKTLVEPGQLSYSTLDDVHTLIIEYEKIDYDISYNKIYFVRDTREYDIPVITGASDFKEGFHSWTGFFELNKKENNDLWKSCRRIALEESGDIVSPSDFLYANNIFNNTEFNRDSPLAGIGKRYLRAKEEPIEIQSLTGGDRIKLVNDGRFKSFGDWKDYIIKKNNLDVDVDENFNEYEYYSLILSLYLDSWEKAKYGIPQLIRQWNELYWWDFKNHTSINSYEYSIELDLINKNTSIDITGGEISFGMNMGDNSFFPLLVIHELPKDITLNSFDKFKSKQTELEWAKLLYNQKAGEYIPSGSADMRQKIANIVRTPKGFVSGDSDLMDVFNESWDLE